MKKIALIVITLFFLVGCRSDLPSDVVKNYFSLYKNQNEKILTELDELIKNEELYDLYKSQKEAEDYRNTHREEFNDYNDYLNYKLDKMKKNTAKANYTINFKVRRKEKEWVLETIPTEDLEKIHGIYNYDRD